MIGALLLAAALAAPPAAPAASPAASPAAPSTAGYAVAARVAPESVTIGDRVRVEIEVTVPPGADTAAPRLDPPPRRWGDAEVLASAAARAVDGRPDRFLFRLELAAFRTGRVELPPLAVAAAGDARTAAPGARPAEVRLQTPPLAFAVRSVLAKDGKDAKPMPPAPPQPLPLGARFWWTLGALLAACAVTAVALARARHRLARPQALAPALPPLERFLAEVAALAAEPSPERVHTGLSMALRRLVGALLHFDAPERTTTEIDQQLRTTRLPTPIRRRLLDLLRRCDEVKFARRPTTRDEARERLEAGRALAAEVQRELAPVVALPPAAREGEAA